MIFPQNQPLPFKGLWPLGFHLGAQQPNCILGNIAVLRDEQAARAPGPPQLRLGERSVGSGGCNFKPLPRLPHQDGAREGLRLHPSLLTEGTSMRAKRSQPWVITVKGTMFHR